MESVGTMARARLRVVPLGVLACVPCADSLAGSITYTGQSRSIKATGLGPEGYVYASSYAPDFQVFDEKVWIGPFAPGTGQQTSTLGESGIAASGYGQGTHYTQTLNSSGESNFGVTIYVNEPVVYKLVGVVHEPSGCGNGYGSISFEGATFFWSIKTSYRSPKIDFDKSGTLMPGIYWLNASGKGWGGQGICSGGKGLYDFALDFTPVCYPDCDQSGSLDIDDFICFQTLYAVGDPEADCDASGDLNIDDFICFQTTYVIGC